MKDNVTRLSNNAKKAATIAQIQMQVIAELHAYAERLGKGHSTMAHNISAVLLMKLNKGIKQVEELLREDSSQG